MTDINKLSIVGDWRIIIQSRDAAWAQKVILFNTASGTQTLNGSPGSVLDIYGLDGNSWELHIQHNDGLHSWQDSWLKPTTKNVIGSSITQIIESEDDIGPNSDRDFNDLVIRLEKLGMVDQPARPFAVWPATMQITPDGMFETALGRYFMAVRIRNIWTEPWPVDTVVGLTQRCRQWLGTGGIVVHDYWSLEDQAAVGQEVVNGRIRVGALQPWELRIIYFKVDVSHSSVRKHNIEVQILQPVAENLNHINRKATNQIFVSETVYDAAQKVFVSQCDHGTLTVAVKELMVDYHSFKRAIGKARELFSNGGQIINGQHSTPGGIMTRCSQKDIEELRKQLLDFLAGKQVDICDIWRNLQCCCAKRGQGGDDGDWTGEGGTGMEFFSFPTVFDYHIQYNPSFAGQYGPIPYDDPWWKAILAFIYIVLTIAAAISAAADLANRSDDVVIGNVGRSKLDIDDNLIDAAVVTLNGNRTIRPSIFSFLDASSDEVNTTPLESLGSIIDSSGTTFTNAQIMTAILNYKANPTDPSAKEGVSVFKSGARSGITFGLMTNVRDAPNRRDDDGITRSFKYQLSITPDPDRPNNTYLSKKGDSGSLWLHVGSKSIVALNWGFSTVIDEGLGSRIEDVMRLMNIRFA